ncbi:hypothetical protein J7E97_23210 [Streptomyces sp. ISL-66]|uniref:hypothetical protein n=1 Tax=Streptomyces sp. ISL-66 TaxID=2819186 RepID=UPI001BE932B0|nr:hypothetical protein [Streptomyces sp. ISL-66]MBT2470698.1 hypothetical protein [Streptomyces sp. ISL-66]
MGLLLSYLAIFLIECALMALQMVGAFLLVLSAALFIRRSALARKRRADDHFPKRTPVAPYVLGGVGICLLLPTSAALFLGRESGLFETWAI